MLSERDRNGEEDPLPWGDGAGSPEGRPEATPGPLRETTWSSPGGWKVLGVGAGALSRERGLGSI